MITKNEANAAWQTIKAFSVAHSNKTSFTKEDVTKRLQDAILTLDRYFDGDTQYDKSNDQ